MEKEKILALLPYQKPFLFVGELLSIDENGAVGTFIFDQNLEFYQGHLRTPQLLRA